MKTAKRLCNILASLWLLWAGSAFAQTLPLQHPCVNTPRNVIKNPDALTNFFHLLKMQEQQGGLVLSILHIGDSHIQADMLTKEVRVGMQKRFGNAGRGFVFPYQVAGSNGPASVRSYATGSWQGGRNVQAQYVTYCGLAGFYLKTNSSNAKLVLKTNAADSLDYSFKHLKLIADGGASSYNLLIGDSTKPYAVFTDSMPRIAGNAVAVEWPTTSNYVMMQTAKGNPVQNHTQLFGMVLENGKPGVLYNVVGVNGAQCGSYARGPVFAEQTRAVAPQLIIISLGTNEAFDADFDTARVEANINILVSNLQKENPDACFIITTPPDCFKSKRYKNPNILATAKIFERYALANDMAVFNLLEAGGGYGNATQWRANGLLAGDGVHFTKTGYALQGQMLLNALLIAYENFKKNNPN